VCVGFASTLSVAAVMMLIFVHVGQINTSRVPRGISLLKVNVSAYSSVLEDFIQNPVSALYTSNPDAPLGEQQGLRQYYAFGLYSYCGFVSAANKTTSGLSNSSLVNSSSTPNPSIGPGAGTCTGSQFAMPFAPYDYITSDMLANYTILSNNFIPETTFRDSKYLTDTSTAAYWMLLLGTISSFLAIITGIKKTHFTFFLSAVFSLLAAILLLIASSTYTILVNKCQSINSVMLSMANSNQKIPVGIVVDVGTGVLLMWAACVCMILSVIPYFINCCTWRG